MRCGTSHIGFAGLPFPVGHKDVSSVRQQVQEVEESQGLTDAFTLELSVEYKDVMEMR